MTILIGWLIWLQAANGFGQTTSPAPNKPKIAIVIDDFGLTYKRDVSDEDWMKLPFPITFAVMPESPWTGDAAVKTKASGHELIVHFPFDPFLKLRLPKSETDPEDVETLVNYHAAYQDQSTPGEPGRMGDIVPASEMIHILPPDTDTTIKRGLPAFAFESGDALNRASKCQRYISIGSAVRAGTAEIWEHDYGTKQDIQDFADSTATRKQVSPYSGRDETLEHSPPGRIRRIPSGQKLVPPPSGVGTAEQLSSVQGDLRQASAGFTAPEYMTGDASNANYASTSMASAPFVKTGETDQEHYKAAFLEIVTRVISWAVSQGRLPEEATSWVTIQIESPAVIHQDKLQQSQVDQAYVTLGAKSIQTVQMEQGLDPEIEAANREQWHERFGAYTPLPMAFSDNPTQPAAGTDASNQPGN